VYAALGFILACNDQPTTASAILAPAFSKVTSTDPTQVLTVGVDAPANVTLAGTVAGIVVVVDNAILDLSKGTVDCNGQTGPDPKIGVWIKNNRTNVHVKGGSTGTIQNCGIGVLIGPPTPSSGEPGGFNNHVDGLVIEHTTCPSGPYPVTELICDVAIAVSNSHDNKIDHNTVSTAIGPIEGGILVYGSDPRAPASGGNKVYSNTLEGGFNSYGIFLSSDANEVRGNVSTDPIEGVVVDRDGNLITENHISYGNEEIAFGIHLLQGADDNTITKNQIRASDIGIVVETNTFRNLIRGNTALAVRGPDAVDRSGACVNNTWMKNTFTTTDPSCILGIPTGNFWQTVAPLPTQRYLLAASVVNGVLYAVGGYNNGAVGTVEAYDPVANNWTAKAPLPTPRGGLAAGVVNGVLYAVGGVDQNQNAVGTVEAYDPVANSWTAKAPLPTPRRDLAVGVVNGVLYAVSGADQNGNLLSTVEAYDPVANSWTAKAALPTPRLGPAAGVVNGVLYVVGGYGGFGTVEAYDPVANSWTAIAPLPTQRYYLSAGVINGVLYAVSGADQNGFPIATVEAYDAVVNGWTTKPLLPTPRYGLAVGVVNDILYAVGGVDQNNTIVGIVEAYHP
jgi:parallel beta-helix repeat protein